MHRIIDFKQTHLADPDISAARQKDHAWADMATDRIGAVVRFEDTDGFTYPALREALREKGWSYDLWESKDGADPIHWIMGRDGEEFGNMDPDAEVVNLEDCVV